MKFNVIDFETFSSSKRWNADYFLGNTVGCQVAKGFKLRKLGELVDERREFLFPKDYPHTTFNYVGLENISQSTRLLVDFVPKEGREVKSRSKIFRNGDILYGRLRPSLNKCLVVDECLTEGICSTEIFVLIPDSDLVHPEYFAELLVSEEIRNRVQALVAGAALPRIQFSDFLEISVPIPTIEAQKEIVAELVATREDLKEYFRKIKDTPQRISSAFARYAFSGKPFELDFVTNNERERWHNPLPLETFATNMKLKM